MWNFSIFTTEYCLVLFALCESTPEPFLTLLLFLFQVNTKLLHNKVRKTRKNLLVCFVKRNSSFRLTWPIMKEAILERNLTVVRSVGKLLDPKGV